MLTEQKNQYGVTLKIVHCADYTLNDDNNNFAGTTSVITENC